MQDVDYDAAFVRRQMDRVCYAALRAAAAAVDAHTAEPLAPALPAELPTDYADDEKLMRLVRAV